MLGWAGANGASVRLQINTLCTMVTSYDRRQDFIWHGLCVFKIISPNPWGLFKTLDSLVNMRRLKNTGIFLIYLAGFYIILVLFSSHKAMKKQRKAQELSIFDLLRN